MTDADSPSSEAHVQIGHDATGNAVITGNGNIVIIQASRRAWESEPQPALAIGPNPYKGLLAFNEQDTNRFFGREEQIAKLWNRFHDLHQPSGDGQPKCRLLPIIGPSGCGKSSLARAGLLPELARRPLSGRPAMLAVVITPGAHPLETLAGVLAQIITGDVAPVAKTRELAEELARPGKDNAYDGLRRIADSISNRQPPRYELYDLHADPHEFRNLAATPEHAATLAELTQALTRWRHSTRDPLLDAQNLARLTAEVSAVKSKSEGKQLIWGYPEYFFGNEPVTPTTPPKKKKKQR